MKAFFGLCFLMGIVRKPRTEFYWSTNRLLSTKIFRDTLTRDRFFAIMRYISVVADDNNPNVGIRRTDPQYDPVWRLRWLVEALNRRFSRYHVPNKNVCVDEVMVPFKGRVHFKQYIKSKPHKWGVKLWALADSSSGYIQRFEMYTGKSDRGELGLAHKVVLDLVNAAGLSKAGYNLYVDNFFSSVVLFLDLWENFGTGCCGTVRLNRIGLPKDIMRKKPQGLESARGSFVHRQRGPLLALVWQDKRKVHVISTIHDLQTEQVSRTLKVDGRWHKEEIPCPKAVRDYTRYMGGVDRADQMSQYYLFSRRAQKWNIKVFFYLLEMAKVNSYHLFTMSPNHRPVPPKRQLSYLQFLLRCTESLIGNHQHQAVKGRPSLQPFCVRLTSRCMPGTFPTRSWCHVCYMRHSVGSQEKRKQTTYGCLTCGKHLCLPGCFADYHQQKHYF